MANKKLYVIDQNTGQIMPLKLIDPGDDTGYSLATSSSGGGSSDASAANQALQLTEAQNTNTKLNTLITQTSDVGTAVSSTLQSAVTGNANGSTAIAGGYATALFQVSGLGTATINFELSNDNGTTWSSLSVFSTGGVITSVATANGLYRAQVAGLDLVNGLIRARVSGYSSGTITVTVTLSTVVAENKYFGSAQLPTALGQTTKANSLAISPANDWTLPKADVLEITGSAGALNGTPIAATDVSAYRWMSIQITGTFVATYLPEWSNDNITWYGSSFLGVGTTGAAASTTGSAVNLVHFPIMGKYFRLRISAYTSGTVSAIAECYVFPGFMQTYEVSSIVRGGVGSAAADSGNPVKTGGKYNSTKPTFTDGQRGDTQIEINGSATTALYGKVTNPGDTPLIATALGRTKISMLGSAVGDGASIIGAVDDSDVATRAAAVGVFYYNGTNADRVRGVMAQTLLASSGRTVTTNSADIVNYNHRGMILTVDISNVGTGSITPSLQYKDSISGNYKTIWTAATPLIANGTYTYGIYPGELNTVSMTEVINALLTRTFRLAVVANNANSVTYSVSSDMQL